MFGYVWSMQKNTAHTGVESIKGSVIPWQNECYIESEQNWIVAHMLCCPGVTWKDDFVSLKYD